MFFIYHYLCFYCTYVAQNKTKNNNNSIPLFQMAVMAKKKKKKSQTYHVCHAQTSVREGSSFPPFQMAKMRKTTTEKPTKIKSGSF